MGFNPPAAPGVPDPDTWGAALVSFAQPVALSPTQLDQLVERIALYPDPLLANILTASTYWSEIPEAASWADQHSYLKGDALAQAMQADHLQAQAHHHGLR